MSDARPIRIALHASLTPWAPEVKYVLCTLTRVAGYAVEFRWAREAAEADAARTDVYYGPQHDKSKAPVSIAAAGRHFTGAPWLDPQSLVETDGVPLLEFSEKPTPNGFRRIEGPRLWFANDIVFACYWLLTGAPESRYPRDRWDNLDVTGSFFLKHDLGSKPLVSRYARLLRDHFESLGIASAPRPWTAGGRVAAAISHDVDYPEMIRWIECLRLLARHGAKGIKSAAGVVRGTNHFWRFADWMDFAKRLGGRSAFYFMANRGSLLQYAMGMPDAFYDVRSARFRDLLRQLKDDGFEIGLHASFNAYRSAGQLRRERQLIEELAGVKVSGNRHHFWHLDPDAPHETLLKHEQAGLVYDSSLAYEFCPGFRRGICHPFRPYHPGQRREIDVVQLPPAWMDDHFDARLVKNGITDTFGHANALVRAARETDGIVVLDYHVRGMNRDFFPRFGPWLEEFVEKHLDGQLALHTPQDLAQMYLAYERQLDADSRDLTADDRPIQIDAPEPSTDGTVAAAPAAAPDPADADADNVSIDLLTPEQEPAWEAFVASHDHGDVYHTLAWRSVTEEGLGHKPLYLRAADRDGRITGALPLFLVNGLFGRRLVSVPMRDRGGVIARDARTASRLVRRAIELTRELNCKYLELRSLHPIDADVVREHDLRCERYWTTTRIDLSPGIDAVWKALDRDAVRWAIGKARKQGLRAAIDDTPAGADLFYELFVRTRCAMGIPPFPPELFRAIHHHMTSRGMANLFVVYKDDVPIHAMINLISKDTFVPAYAAPQNAHRAVYPSEFMIWSTIEWATQNGFRYYDFGADSPRQTGLLFFKKKWGGLQQPMLYCYYLNGADAPPSFDSTSRAYELARKVWTRMPVRMSKYLGSRVTRQFS